MPPVVAGVTLHGCKQTEECWVWLRTVHSCNVLCVLWLSVNMTKKNKTVCAPNAVQMLHVICIIDLVNNDEHSHADWAFFFFMPYVVLYYCWKNQFTVVEKKRKKDNKRTLQAHQLHMKHGGSIPIRERFTAAGQRGLSRERSVSKTPSLQQTLHGNCSKVTKSVFCGGQVKA